MKQPYCDGGLVSFGNTSRLLAALVLFSSVSCLTANAGLTITPNFGASITGDVNAAAIEAGINSAITTLQGIVNNNVTVTIDFEAITNGLGQSSSTLYDVSYSSYVNALYSNQTLSANDMTALASIPNGANNPVNGKSVIETTAPLLRALGYTAPGTKMGTYDSVISFNFSLLNLSRMGPQNTNNYDLISTALHEMNEVLGIGGNGSVIATNAGALTNEVAPLDLYRYSAPGVRSFTTSSNAAPYFSINGGTNSLVNFNQYGHDSDYGDWGDGVTPADGDGNTPGQVQDAFGTPGGQENMGANETTALDIVGWNVVPEPSTIALVTFGLAGAWSFRRRKT